MLSPHRSRRAATIVALSALLPLAGCGQDDPVEDEGTEVVGGNAAPDEAVTEDITITALELAFPEDGLWEEGDDVPLYAAIANTGNEGDRLVDVRGEEFGGAELVGHDGTAGSIEVREDDTLYLEPAGEPSVMLQDLETSLRSSQSIEVTFVLEGAGEVTMEAPVAAASPAEEPFTTPEDPTD